MVGQTTTITCSTVVPVQSIQWFAENGSVVNASSERKSALELRLLIDSTHNNTRYRCMVHDGDYMESKNIIISVGRKSRMNEGLTAT